MTRRIIPLPRDPHRDLQAMLPWYVAGRLDAADRAQMEAHLASCAACQAELREERVLAVELANLPSPQGSPGVEHGWAAMSQQLNRETASRPSLGERTVELVGRLGGRSEATWLRWAVAAQFCALAAMGLAIWRPAAPLATVPASYHALGAAPAPASANLVVVFRPDTPEEALRKILRGSDARLVGGPTEADAYLLHVPATARAKALLRLRAEAQVLLAEPVDAG